MPIVFVKVDLESLIEQPFKGTHLDVGHLVLETADEGRRGMEVELECWMSLSSCLGRLNAS